MTDQPKGIRDLGRELAFYSLFVYDSRSLSLTELLDFNWYYRMTEFDLEDGELISIPEHVKKDVFEFASLLVNGTVGNLEKIDNVISEHLVKWTFDRLHAADRANLRIAVYALLYRFDIPVEVTIAEANELAEKYSEDNSSNYVNGILNKVKEKYRTNTLLKQPPLKIKRKVIGIKPSKAQQKQDAEVNPVHGGARRSEGRDAEASPSTGGTKAQQRQDVEASTKPAEGK